MKIISAQSSKCASNMTDGLIVVFRKFNRWFATGFAVLRCGV